MKKGSSITKLVIVCVALIIGVLAAVCDFEHVFGTSYNYNSFASSISLGLDLKGGVSAVYEASSEGTSSDFETKMESTKSRLTELLVSKGYTEAVVVTEGENRIRVDVPDENDPAQIFEIIGRPAKVRFKVGDDVILTNDDVISATSAYGSTGNGTEYYVSLELTGAGQTKFTEATGKYVGSAMDVYLVYTDVETGEETEEKVTSPTIETQITGNPIITCGTGSNASAQAEKIASQITSGTFDLTLTLMSADTIPATLGEKALMYSLIAGAIGLIVICVFLVIRYGLMGVAGSLSLIAYTVLNLLILALFPLVQLSLPGIAGVLLSIGMAVDGIIVILERIREEFRSGKSILASFHAGIKKSRSSIIDGNITTLIAAILLAVVGTGSVAGFGITLTIGIIIAMISSLLIFWFILRQFVNLCCDDENKAKWLGLKRPVDNVVNSEVVAVEADKEGGAL